MPHSIGPYYLKSEGPERGVYVRFGSTNRSVDTEMLDSLRLLAKKITYDELPHPEGHLDSEVMKNVFEWVGKRPTVQALENLGVETSRSGKKYPSNGGILLFGVNRLQLFPDSQIRCARFAGSTREKILDQIDINSPLPLAADLIIAFIERNVSKEGQIGRMQRIDVLQYPPVAIREAVINALLHTDYAMTGCHIQIAIHHGGSTSVPGLSAKPVIDMIGVVKNPEKVIHPLENLGFKYKGESSPCGFTLIDQKESKQIFMFMKKATQKSS